MAEKFVVIGSNSFSGSHFVNGALIDGASVVGMSRSAPPAPPFLPYAGKPQAANYRFFQLDLNHDLDRIMGVIEDFRPDYVVNFAAQAMVAESWTVPEHWFQTNVVANVKLHDRLRQCTFLKKYVHVSTPEVYGSTGGLVREDAAYNPSTPYAVSRAACDLSLMSFFRRYQFPVVFTRAANVFGPGQQLYRVIPKTIMCIKAGTRLPLDGGGKSVRSFIHIRDVVDGTLRAARVSPPGEVYHLSTREQISIKDLVARTCSKLGVRFDDHVDVAPERPGKDAAYLLDSAKARALLGWTDRVGLDEGIAETVTWVNDHYEELKRLPQKYEHKP